MPTLRIHCACGQPYSFEVEPVNGRMPWPVKCPACGAEGTGAANDLLAQTVEHPTGEPCAGDDLDQGRAVTEWVRVLKNVWVPAPETNPRPSLRPDWARVLRNAPEIWQIPLGFTVAGVIAGWLLNPWWFCLVLATLKSAWDDYRTITRLLKHGQLCPAVLLGDQPGRAAVLANLSAAGGYSPVVRVFPESLVRLAQGPHRPGARLAAVAFYLGPKGAGGDWQYFRPEIVNKLVSDPAEIQRAFDAIPEADWRRLESVAPQLASQPAGLYRLDELNAPARSIFTTGQRRAFWAMGVVLAAIAIGVVGILIQAHRDTGGSGSLPSASGARSRFPGPENQAPPNRGGLGNFSVGDAVEVMDMGRWRGGKVVEVDGFRYRVRLKDGGSEQWVMRGQMRAVR